MFGTDDTESFVNRATAPGTPKSGWVILLVLVLLGAFGIWAATFEIEEVTRAQGRVVPGSQVQDVQSLEGGLVRDIAVREGDIVEAGQVLLQIDDTGFQSRLGELRQQEAALSGQRIRFAAEAAGQTPEFPEALDAFPNVVAAEQALFDTRRAQLAQELNILRGQTAQRRAELAETEALENRIEKVLGPLREELTLSERLLSQGVMPQIEVLRLRARVAEQEGDLEIARATKERLRVAAKEAEQRIEAAQSAFVLEAREGLTEAQTRLAVVRETIKSASDRVTRTALRSPVRGTVKSINVSTIGSVVQPGVPVVEIVPLDDGLLIEADVLPQDVAFISPESEASVKITAYDYLVYGALDASVERISADAFSDDRGQTFFKVALRTEQSHLGGDDDPLPIIPGMMAQVDIQTGTKTVLTYLAQPLLRAQSEALRER